MFKRIVFAFVMIFGLAAVYPAAPAFAKQHIAKCHKAIDEAVEKTKNSGAENKILYATLNKLKGMRKVCDKGKKKMVEKKIKSWLEEL